jgi:flagellar hook-length control protein FliK
VQLIGQGIPNDASAITSDPEPNELLHTCLTTGCEPAPGGEKVSPNSDEASTVAVSAELIAQATPLVILQVSTDDRDTLTKAADDGQQPTASKLHRSAQVVPVPSKLTSKLGEVNAPATSVNQAAAPPEAQPEALETVAIEATPATEPPLVTPDKAPSKKTVLTDNLNSPAPVIPQPLATKVQTVPADGANPIDAVQNTAEPRAVRLSTPEQKQPEDDSPLHSVEFKPNALAAASATDALTSVTLVTPAVLPQSASLSTVSAGGQPVGKTERLHIGEIASSREPGSMPALHPEGSSADEQQAPVVRELSEPARHVRDPVAADRGEIARTNLNEADRVRFVQRVARAMHTAVDRGGEVRLRLSPPELGHLTLDLVVRDGVMSARLEAETQSARSLLVDNLPALRERLADQNVRIDRFDVNLRGGTSGFLPDRTPNQSGQQTNHGTHPASRQRDTLSSGGNLPTSQPIYRHIQTNDQLNVVV